MLTMILAAAAATATPPADYSQDKNWLCRPDRRDACSTESLDATQVDADGTLTKIPFVLSGSKPKVDCFYVYPTLSNDPGGNSDLIPNAEERFVVKAQFSRFASVCRTFAPMYRQVTLGALRTAMTGALNPGDTNLAYEDVRAAFKRYMAKDNKGRPFVLIGHSQGSRMLNRLIKDEVDGKAVQKRMLSAMLIGFNTLVPVGKDVGGDFKTVRLCRSDSQTGCVIGYVSFRDDSPPPAKSRFGKSDVEGMAIACTNPAALAGGKALLDSYLGAKGASNTATAPIEWAKGADIATDFVKTPGLLSGECINDANGSYLAVTTNADPADPRTDKIVGDVVVMGVTLKDWGLHLIDVSVAQGDLIRLVGTQEKAYFAKRR